MKKKSTSKKQNKKEVTFEDELSDRTKIKKQLEKMKQPQQLKQAKRYDDDYNEYMLSQKYNKKQFEVDF